jgi:hypothetical protein
MPSADQVPVKSSHSMMRWHIVGCPDRRIDRLCITCCSPSQPHITPIAGVISARVVDAILIATW